MSEVIGFWLVMEAIIILLSIVVGSSFLDNKEVAKIILSLSLFITMVTVGAYLIVG